MWHKLLEVIRKELGLYRLLQTELKADRERIISFDTKELLAGNQRKEILSMQLQNLEEARTRLVEEITRSLGLDSSGLTLSMLYPHIPEVLRSQFKESAFQLQTVVRKVQCTNQENGKLVEHSLSYIDQSIAFLKHLIKQKDLYLPSGKLTGLQKAGKIVESKA